MSPGLIALLVLLAAALAIGAYLRSRGRPAVEAGPKARGSEPADPALSPLVETQGVPPGMTRPAEKDAVRKEFDRRERPPADGA